MAHKPFSVSAHGERGAFTKAVAARKELLLLIDDRPYLKNAIAKRAADVSRRGQA